MVSSFSSSMVNLCTDEDPSCREYSVSSSVFTKDADCIGTERIFGSVHMLISSAEPSNTKTDSTNEPSTTDTSNKDTSNTEPTQPSGKNMGNPSADPPKETTSETGDPASAQQNTQKHQGADRPGEGPDSGESQKIKDTKKEAEEAAAVDVSGPGPKTLEEKSKEGGAAGAGKKDDDDDDGPQKESHGEGTGEKYVKSSGMKVDGGDFDASAPGAGKEADREFLFAHFGFVIVGFDC